MRKSNPNCFNPDDHLFEDGEEAIRGAVDDEALRDALDDEAVRDAIGDDASRNTVGDEAMPDAVDDKSFKDAVDKARSKKDFPQLSVEPNIFELDPSQMPILNINLRGRDDPPKRYFM